MASIKKRNYLPLKKKVEVIEFVEKNPGISMRSIGELFNCGKTQIGQILKNKESILTMYESTASGRGSVHIMTSRPSEFAEVNKTLYEWYTLACSKNIYPGGPQLTEKAKEIAERLGKSSFKGSRGWLDKWKKRYNVKQLKICGQSSDMSEKIIDSWKERLPEIIDGYRKEDIWNMDEVGIFWQALPDFEFGNDGRQSLKRVTVAFFVSAAGQKQKPVLIWKVQKPRCLQKFDKSILPVSYYSQSNAWMTAEILEAVLSKLNFELSRAGRSILLLIDNADCHREDLTTKFSNIKVCFLPAKLQPLGLGIIQNFKVHYRSILLRYVLSKMDVNETPDDVVKSLNILVAIRWIALAWSMVTEETICKCFQKAGILCGEPGAVSHRIEDKIDPFMEVEARSEMQSLIERITPPDKRCTVDEYLRGDNDLPICVDLDSESWEADFMAQVGTQEEELEEGGENGVVHQSSLKVTSYKEAVERLEAVQCFLEDQGHLPESLEIGCTVDAVARLKLLSGSK